LGNVFRLVSYCKTPKPLAQLIIIFNSLLFNASLN